MNNVELSKMGLRNLFRRKLRTSLTVMGVVVGTASVVIMLSLGIGLQESFMQNLERMGDLRVITVHQQHRHHEMEVKYGSGGSRSRSEETKKLNEETIKEIEAFPGVMAVMRMTETHLKFTSGRYETHLNVMGINSEVMEHFDFNIKEGRLLNDSDTNAVVFGGQVAMQFYNPREMHKGGGGGMHFGGGGEFIDGEFVMPKPPVDVLNDSVFMSFDTHHIASFDGQESTAPKRPKRIRIEAVGLLDDQQFDEFSWGVMMDIDYLEKLITDNERRQGTSGGSNRQRGRDEKQYNRIRVRVEDIEDVKGVQEYIRNMGFNAHSLGDMVEEMKGFSRTVQAVLGGIGAIAFLVAALGITNTMIMSIYERTREIGVMKVLGCKLVSIRNLFLFESAMIGFFGGLIGLGISYGISLLLNLILGPMMGGGMVGGEENIRISVIPIWLAFAGVMFSMLVGLISGYYPARRAMKISALKAIKTE
ncbi:MAG: ABC transporter permease [Clostridiales bacterium]|nr:ABC transporter permease [Clostridiales bacterium]